MRTPTISYDYDDTLFEGYGTGWGGFGEVPIMEFVETLESYYALGCRIIIITARSNTFEHRQNVESKLKEFGLINMIDKIIFTSHNLKGKYAFDEGVVLHYDDSIYHLQDCKSFGIKVINSRPDQLLGHTV